MSRFNQAQHLAAIIQCGGPGLADSGGGWDDPGKGV